MSKPKPELLGLPELRALASDPRVLLVRLVSMLGGKFIRIDWSCSCGWTWSCWSDPGQLQNLEMFHRQRLEHLKTCSRRGDSALPLPWLTLPLGCAQKPV